MRHLTLALLFTAAAAAAADNVRSYALPGHGSLELEVPAAWQDIVERTQGLPPTIKVSAKEGPDFQVLLTPIWAASPDKPLPTKEQLKAGVQRMADHVAKQAVEPVVEVKELKGRQGSGYYFSATDRRPRRNEYKYMTQGILALGDVHMSFTILTNDGQEKVARDALEMVSRARHRRDKGR